MSLFATVNGKYVADVATNKGWSDFVEWAEQRNSTALLHLVEHGWTDDISDLYHVLRADLEKAAPDVRSVGQGILDAIASVKDGDVLLISDGVGGDGDSEEDDLEE